MEFSDLTVGQRVIGLDPSGPVTIKAVDQVSETTAELIFLREDGSPAALTVTDHEISGLKLAVCADQPNFSAPAEDFLLAVEALRISYAARHDPMVAVTTSVVDPLPHQIRAVYADLLPRIPLRFLLADDPGAGKTIMAGLYLKELILRADCERALIVAPGSLVEQWQEELLEKFNLRFSILNPSDQDGRQPSENIFKQNPFLIARMDQLCRNEDLMEQLSEVTWDVAVVDEAHRMSAHYSSWGGDVKETSRFKLGRLLSQTAHHYLLMTATPHTGKEEDFQLFMSLLDEDRFAGRYRGNAHDTDTEGLMRRLVKEDLLTFEGKPLFPQRRAYTAAYQLSAAEQDLYDQVTEYVRTEMGRANQLDEDGDRRRANNIGFALTMLQRRLASSPRAITRSLERRRDRLQYQAETIASYRADPSQSGGPGSDPFPGFARSVLPDQDLPQFDLSTFDDLVDEVSEDGRADFEEQVEQVIDQATAAQTLEELRAEIAVLDDLIVRARVVLDSGEDRKWNELRSILNEQVLGIPVGSTGTICPANETRKIIIFTEHRDTLDYLQEKIVTHLGRAEAVLSIHGGTARKERLAVREAFTHDSEAVVLLATDAAGEGLNLQRAHLMVNYDLPWNPNRIEQRFGRIHRIGQRNVCHLWNLIATGTREGDVFNLLLTKIATQSKAYNGNLFNVLGEKDAFQDQSLRDLLLQAIQFGEDPAVRQRWEQVIDQSVADGLDELLEEESLHPGMRSRLDLDEARELMERARRRRLQPGYIQAFFLAAFPRLGGRMRERIRGRYVLAQVPRSVIETARLLPGRPALPDRVERVTFNPDLVEVSSSSIYGQVTSQALLLAPGEPLLDAVVKRTIDDYRPALSLGTILVDKRPTQGAQPHLVFLAQEEVVNHLGDTVSKHFDYPQLHSDGSISVSDIPPFLDFDVPTPVELAAAQNLLGSFTWLSDLEAAQSRVRSWVTEHCQLPLLEELRSFTVSEVERVRVQVQARLTQEINYWYSEVGRLAEQEALGRRARISASGARSRAEQLEYRLQRRTEELKEAKLLHAKPVVFRGVAVVVPSHLLAPADTPGAFARDTKGVERRAVEAVLASERRLGRFPKEMPFNNPGFDIESVDEDGNHFFIEVKGRIEGAESFTVTRNEVEFAQTQGDHHLLALVEVSAAGPLCDEVRYVARAFDHLSPSATTRSYNEVWSDYWSRGWSPQ